MASSESQRTSPMCPSAVPQCARVQRSQTLLKESEGLHLEKQHRVGTGSGLRLSGSPDTSQPGETLKSYGCDMCMESWFCLLSVLTDGQLGQKKQFLPTLVTFYLYMYSFLP